MNKRHYLILRGSSCALVVIGLLIALLFKKIDEFGIIFGCIFIPILIYLSYSYFSKLKETEKEEVLFVTQNNSSANEQISYFNKIAILGGIAFTILSIWTYFDLKDLESGTVEYVRLWAPISLLYDLGGFWLAVAAMPVLGIISTFLLFRKMRALKYKGQ